MSTTLTALTIVSIVFLSTASAGLLGALVYLALLGCAIGALVFIGLIVRDARGGRLW